ncbi:MAG TPA: PEP-CTERM sorting domain-containing protein [Methylophilaceae bacterium]|jgi:hypothetical protein
MKNIILKQAIASTILALSANAANAQSITFNFDYIAQAQTSAALSPGASIASLSATATPVGSITFTDLSDLNLGDGKTGVRISANLTGLGQFSSGTGSIYSNTIEFSFPGTGSGTGGVEFITSTDSLRNVSGVQFTTGGDGGIEWDEHGSVGNGSVNTATSHRWAFFQQQNNVLAGTWTGGNVTFDYLNGGAMIDATGSATGQTFNGFSVASLISVANQDGVQPNAYSWLRVRSTDGGIQKTGQWFDPYLLNSTNATTGITTQTLNFLAIAAVPETDTYAMLLAGLGVIGMIVRRRTAA